MMPTFAAMLARIEATPLDLIAFPWFLACTLGYNLSASLPALARRSLIGAIQRQRVRWMTNMAARDDRFIDIVLVGNLANGNSFFASTSVILLGALSALLGSGERVQAIIAHGTSAS